MLIALIAQAKKEGDEEGRAPKRPRGRPPKKSAPTKDDDGNEAEATPKKRGRPPKSQS